MKLHNRILIGLVAGAAAGIAAHAFWPDAAGTAWLVRHVSRPVGQVFLRLLFMLVAPLLFASLALGVAALGDLRSLGRLGLKTFGYALLLSSIAVFLGVGLVRVFRPGAGVAPETRTELSAGAAERAAAVTRDATPAGLDLFVQIVPRNPVEAAAEGDYLALMFFALVFGIGLLLVSGPAVESLKQALQGLNDVMMALIGLVIRFAPIGVTALLFTLTAELGYGVLVSLSRYVGVVLLALLVHQFVVYPLALRFLARTSPLAFFRAVREPMITAFSTSSSNATLPTALRAAERELKLPPEVSRFVLTIGSTANQNGTALFEGVTVLFLAQFYGVELALAEQVTVVVICILGGIGTAGVPSGSIPVIAMILTRVGVPVEGIGLVLGVDRLLDMCRTVLNVTGDLTAAVFVANSEARRAPARAGAEGRP